MLKYITSILLLTLCYHVLIGQTKQLSQGAAVLFNGVSTKLTVAEQNQLYKVTNFELNSDGKTFSPLGITSMGAITTSLYPVSLKSDGDEQIFIKETSRHDNIEFVYITLYIKNEKGKFKNALFVRSDIPNVLSASTLGYPDLVLSVVANNGTTSSNLYQWNGESDYKKRGVYNNPDNGQSLQAISAKYVASIGTNKGQHVEANNQKQTLQASPGSPVAKTDTNRIIGSLKSTSIIKNKNFKILSEWVTHPTDNKFKFYDWAVAPDDLKAAARYVDGESIDEALKNGCSVSIAAIDLDDNGIAGIAVYEVGEYCCGHGFTNCGFDINENGGAWNAAFMESNEPLPKNYAKNLNQEGKNTAANKLKGNEKILFSYDTAGLNLTPKKIIPSSSLVGRWKVIDASSDGFSKMELQKRIRSRQSEMLFTSAGKCMMYEKGVVTQSVHFTIENNTIVLTDPAHPGNLRIDILSLDTNELQTKITQGGVNLTTVWQKE